VRAAGVDHPERVQYKERLTKGRANSFTSKKEASAPPGRARGVVAEGAGEFILRPLWTVEFATTRADSRATAEIPDRPHSD
jgi:hypothetical protein